MPVASVVKEASAAPVPPDPHPASSVAVAAAATTASVLCVLVMGTSESTAGLVARSSNVRRISRGDPGGSAGVSARRARSRSTIASRARAPSGMGMSAYTCRRFGSTWIRTGCPTAAAFRSKARASAKRMSCVPEKTVTRPRPASDPCIGLTRGSSTGRSPRHDSTAARMPSTASHGSVGWMRAMSGSAKDRSSAGESSTTSRGAGTPRSRSTIAVDSAICPPAESPMSVTAPGPTSATSASARSAVRSTTSAAVADGTSG